MKFSQILATTAAAFLLLTACASTGSASDPLAPITLGGSKLNTAYSLYQEQVKDQKRVDQIFITKSGSPDIRALTKEISAFSKEELATLKEYEKAGVRMNKNGLPPAEIQARQAIEGIKTSQLLGSSGAKFRARLLSTEVEAVIYAQALSKIIADSEKNPARKEHLAQSSKKWEEFANRLDTLLAQ